MHDSPRPHSGSSCVLVEPLQDLQHLMRHLLKPAVLQSALIWPLLLSLDFGLHLLRTDMRTLCVLTQRNE